MTCAPAGHRLAVDLPQALLGPLHGVPESRGPQLGIQRGGFDRDVDLGRVPPVQVQGAAAQRRPGAGQPGQVLQELQVAGHVGFRLALRDHRLAQDVRREGRPLAAQSREHGLGLREAGPGDEDPGHLGQAHRQHRGGVQRRSGVRLGAHDAQGLGLGCQLGAAEVLLHVAGKLERGAQHGEHVQEAQEGDPERLAPQAMLDGLAGPGVLAEHGGLLGPHGLQDALRGLAHPRFQACGHATALRRTAASGPAPG